MRRLLVLLLLPVLGGWTSACGDCDRDCVPGPNPEPVEATVLVEGDDVVRFRIGAEEVDVRVSGKAEVLLADRSYLVPIYPGDDGELPIASLPTGCSCGSVITQLDGSEVDTGSGLPSDLRAIAVVTMLGFAAFVTAWGAVRHLRGRPLF